ncbi:MAG: amino acid permease [Kiritimatiellae bacterium]|nr:amino acid permease [Kiritimatiellia bacterium]
MASESKPSSRVSHHRRAVIGGAQSFAKGNCGLLAAWALAFGCAIGWDAFVLPWTTFLPKAGPVGTILGLIVGGIVMAVVAWNYHFMINRRPGPGGAYAYASTAFGPDKGFLCAWFLCFAYVSIVWLDATVLAYFLQHLTNYHLHFRFAFHYRVAENEVCTMNILISLIALAIAAAVCCRRSLSGRIQTIFAIVLVVGILVAFGGALFQHEGRPLSLGPAFSPMADHPFAQILGLVNISPWLFVGFEAISHISGEFCFPVRKSYGVMVAAIVSVVVAYALVSFIPILVPGLATDSLNWHDAVASVTPSTGNDIAFGTIGRCFRGPGRIVVAVIFVAAVFTNLIGNTIAASRLLAAMADDDALPPWFGRRNADGAPRNAVIAIAVLSLIVFSFGETVIGIVVDLALIGAALAYAYTSAATFKLARQEDNRTARNTGLLGLVVSVVIVIFYVLPNHSSHLSRMATASYLVIGCWCIIGLVLFLSVLRRDSHHRFGQTPVVWLTLSAMIIFMSVLWVRQSTFENTGRTFDDIVALQEEAGIEEPKAGALREAVRRHQKSMTRAIMHDGLVQTSLTVLGLILMLRLYFIHRRRERTVDEEKANARSLFFSTMSHDIRTPLNAIIGFSEMLNDGALPEEDRKQAVDSILVSGKTLLALVNDILDLSKLESGKMEIVLEPTDVPRLLRDVLETFRIAAGKPGLELKCRVGDMPPLMLDPQRLRQIVFNLLGNAVKFTDKGYIELSAGYAREPGSNAGTFRLAVEDTGCGISDEDLKRIASPFVQVGSKGSRNGGTGLGLAICKQLADAMGGKLEVASEVEKGSTFTVAIPGVATAVFAHPDKVVGTGGPVPDAQPRKEVAPSCQAPQVLHPGVPAGVAQTCAKGRISRILLVDDSKMNLSVLKALLKRAGEFDITTADDGRKALDLLKGPDAKPFDLVLTDMWMPNLDGEGLIKAIRADPVLAPLRVVAVTADVTLKDNAAKLGFDDALLKPITTATLNPLLAKLAKG